MRMIVLSIVCVALLGCTGTGVAVHPSCDAATQLCYQGYVLDRKTTRTQFGIQGLIQADRDTL